MNVDLLGLYFFFLCGWNRQFMHAPEHREKEKNSQVRYQRFVRSVNTGAGAHPHSKQATMRRGGQATHKVNVAPPAWMANSELS